MNEPAGRPIRRQ